MRKGIVISIAMLIFSLAVFIGLSAEIAKQADMVEFEETLLEGDRRAAVVIPINEENSGILEENLNHLLLVYEGENLSYMGKYTCSLDNGKSYTNRQNTDVSLDGPVEVSW